MRDFIGQELKIGDYVAFAKRSGNRGEMGVRRVVELYEEGGYRYSVRLQAQSGRTGWTQPSNTIVLSADAVALIREQFE